MGTPWILGALAYLCFGSCLQSLLPLIPGKAFWNQIPKERAKLREAIRLLLDIEEQLMLGAIPPASAWESLRDLGPPWGTLCADSLLELRSQGASLLPTLQRLRHLAQNQEASLADAQARSSQSLAQAGISATLIPLLGFSLYELLPGLQENARAWFLGCIAAWGWNALGAIWMLRIAEAARWGGLPVTQRPWLLLSSCAGERLLAWIRGGIPPDLAWAKTSGFLEFFDPLMAEAWGHSLWDEKKPQHGSQLESASWVILDAGQSLRKTVQTCILEGTPSRERIEVALEAMRARIKACIERELQLLGTRSLKPLFLCVAPGALALFAWALYLSSGELLGSAAGASVSG